MGKNVFSELVSKNLQSLMQYIASVYNLPQNHSFAELYIAENAHSAPIYILCAEFMHKIPYINPFLHIYSEIILSFLKIIYTTTKKRAGEGTLAYVASIVVF